MNKIKQDDHYLKTELYKLVQEDHKIFDFFQAGSLDGIWYWDLENPENEWMSPQFWENFGYDPATKRHLVSEWQNLINQEDLKLSLENFDKHKKDPNNPYDQIVRYKRSDGSTAWVRCRGLIIRNEKGEPIRMLGAHTDITALKEVEKKYRLLVSAFGEVVYEHYVPENKIIWNGRYEPILGYSEEEMGSDGKSWTDRVHPNDIEHVYKEFGRAEKEDQRFRYEYRFRKKDGSFIWVEDLGIMEIGSDRKASKVVGVMRDISQQRKWLTDLEVAKTQFQSAFEYAPIGIALVSTEGKWVDVNEAVCQIVGYSKEELLQKTFQEITHPEDLETDLAFVQEMLAYKRDHYQMEKRYFHKDGSVIWVLLSVSLVSDSNKNPQFFISQIQNISTKKQAEEEIQAKMNELKRMNEVMIGREMQMITLKEELKKLKGESDALPL